MNIAFRNIFFIPFDKLGHELNHSAFVYDWFVCLFGGITPHSRIVRSYGDVTIAGEMLQNFTYARHSYPLSNEGS